MHWVLSTAPGRWEEVEGASNQRPPDSIGNWPVLQKLGELLASTRPKSSLPPRTDAICKLMGYTPPP